MVESQSAIATFPVMEQFYSIQGEGFHQGKAAYFIRLGGCDVGCHWCDVKESWDADVHPNISVEDITAGVSKEARIVIITGGEPLMYDLDFLTGTLRKKGLKTHLETSGAHPLTGRWDWICFSPKKFARPKDEFYRVADELKIVVYNKSDFGWAEEHKERISGSCKFFLQPEWSKAREMQPLILDYIRKNPEWQISLQIHKYLNIP